MIKPLTSLRFIFAFMVFCCHSSFLQYGDSPFYKWLYLNVLLEGYVGVSFFFILSGFILSISYPFLIFLGEVSFAFYLIHQLVQYDRQIEN